MTAEVYPELSFEDFLRHQQGRDQRMEFAGRRIYAMAGGTERHDIAAVELMALLREGRPAGCVVLGQNRLLRTAAADDATYIPDVLLRCGPAGHDTYETSAALIAEVLSPATARYDRVEKLAAYRTVPGLVLYLLVDVGAAKIDVMDLRRDSTWVSHGAGDVVITPYGDIDVSAFFAGIEEQAT